MRADNLHLIIRSISVLFLFQAGMPVLTVRAEDPQAATVYFLDGPVGVKLHPTDPGSLYGSVQCGSTGPAFVEAILINDKGIGQWCFHLNMEVCPACKLPHGFMTLRNPREGIAAYSSNVAKQLWTGYIDFMYRAPDGGTLYVRSLTDPNDPVPIWEGTDLKGWISVPLNPVKKWTDKSLRGDINPGKVVLLVSKDGYDIDIHHITFQPSSPK